jgi:hypothetical protein
MSIIAPKPCKPQVVVVNLKNQLEVVRSRRQNEIDSVISFHSVENNSDKISKGSEYGNGRIILEVHQLNTTKQIRLIWIEKIYSLIEYRALLRLAKFVYNK